MDGIVMGGGVGVSIHGSLRIATERTVFAMPETGIGLFPDVGGTWFLPRLPGQIGMWLGLTGSRLRSREVLSTGICDEIIHARDIERLIDLMSRGLIDVSADRIPKDQLFEYFDPNMVEPSGQREDGWRTLPNRHLIDAAFGQESVDDILQWLSDSQTDWSRDWRKTILSKSPTCTRIAFRQIRAGASLDFEGCMRLEYRLARFCMTRPDFYEGVRAVILDKDNAPKWTPATLAEADDAHVAPAFAPLGEEELLLGSG
jgi:enoyl-CoA hydratase